MKPSPGQKFGNSRPEKGSHPGLVEVVGGDKEVVAEVGLRDGLPVHDDEAADARQDEVLERLRAGRRRGREKTSK